MTTLLALFLSLTVPMFALWAAALHWQTHFRHQVPGLAFIAFTMGVEAVELALMFIVLGLAPAGVLTLEGLLWIRLISVFRITAAVGFWLGVRWSKQKVMDVTTVSDAIRFAHRGWMAFFRGQIKRL